MLKTIPPQIALVCFCCHKVLCDLRKPIKKLKCKKIAMQKHVNFLLIWENIHSNTTEVGHEGF